MRSADIRETFLKFFEEKGHTRVRSSSLIPAADPTLLFTNAGMVQFKFQFLGQEDKGYTKATSSQKCVRAGGKHNDLENVGFTPRHHTFFEMLGNFSFGDYFKEEAIAYAWDLLLKKLSLPKEKLLITVYEKDDEAFELWKKIGVPTSKIFRLGEKDNFWAMGDTGPCGPCTEIHYDWGKEYATPGAEENPGADDKRFLEIWNLVFMQFNRSEDGNLTKLPKPSVDTGAGLERLASVLQGKYSNYETDLFADIKQAIEKRTGKKYDESHKDKKTNGSMCVLMDHVRSSTFLISDGVNPSNEGRGYVLRRILRRAIRHGKVLGKDEPFLYQLVSPAVSPLQESYKELDTKLAQEIVKEEEVKFHETLHRGMGELETSLRKVKKSSAKTLPGKTAFKLYDTFGFPLDLTQVICREAGVEVDEAGFNESMELQRQRSSGSMGTFGGSLDNTELAKKPSSFIGYSETEGVATIDSILNEDGSKTLKELKEGESGYLSFESTPFYAESGGQVGDRGTIRKGTSLAEVLDTIKANKAIAHKVRVKKGSFQAGESCELKVDKALRLATARNHTATHLMHAALRSLPEIGGRIKQAGSLVNEKMLRFDFSCPRALTSEEIEAVEKSVNKEIQKSEAVTTQEMSFDDAKEQGALAFFDEKYGDVVRVIRVGEKENPYSVELCGGTHLKSSADVLLFKIQSESSIASGTRRIVAVTGTTAQKTLFEQSKQLSALIEKLKVPAEQADQKIDQLLKENKKLKIALDEERVKSAQAGQGNGGGALWEKKESISDFDVVTEKVSAANPKVLRSLVDQVRDKLKERTFVVLASHHDEKVFLCVGLTKDLTQKFDATAIIKNISSEVGGSGGGRKDFAQAGGSQPEGIPKAFEKFKRWLRESS